MSLLVSGRHAQRETLDDYFRNTQIMKTKQVIFKTIACERSTYLKAWQSCLYRRTTNMSYGKFVQIILILEKRAAKFPKHYQ